MSAARIIARVMALLGRLDHRLPVDRWASKRASTIRHSPGAQCKKYCET